MGLIDLRGDSLCVWYEMTVINISEKTVKQKKRSPPSFLQAVAQLGLVRLWEIFLFIELSLMIDLPMQ